MLITVDKVLKEFDSKTIKKVKKMKFIGVDGYDVYNLTAPFLDEGKYILAGRVERRDSENSIIGFFEEIEPDVWSLIIDYPTFELQDPYVSFIGGDLVLGGTKISPCLDNPKQLCWHAEKLKGSSVRELKSFFEGPKGMKDIRLAELNNGEIVILSRPQGEKGGRGKIGVDTCSNLNALTKDLIDNAPLLEQFNDEEWGGGNEIHILSDDLIGVLGHVANFDNEDNRHYYPMIFTYNLKTKKQTPIEIICKREFLEPGESKRKDLEDVLFSGGLIRNSDGTATLYTGVSDCESHYAVIEDPFTKHEEV